MNKHIKKGVFIGVGYIIIKWTVIGLVGTYLYRNGLWNNWYFLAIPIFGLTVLLIRKYLRRKREAEVKNG